MLPYKLNRKTNKEKQTKLKNKQGGTGEGVARIVGGLETSKHVIATLDEESGVLTLQRI